MNWRKGMVRVWVVATCAWVGFLAYTLYDDVVVRRRSGPSWYVFLAFAVVPPMAAIGVVKIGQWVYRGFVPPTK